VREGQAPRMFICPNRKEESPVFSSDANLLPGAVTESTDYVFIPVGDYGDDPGLIMAFELPANHRQEVANVLYLDCHVSAMVPYPSLVQDVQKLNEFLAKARRGDR
jgi:prepilin-type processing-associated H-X9-DG protein